MVTLTPGESTTTPPSSHVGTTAVDPPAGPTAVVDPPGGPPAVVDPPAVDPTAVVDPTAGPTAVVDPPAVDPTAVDPPTGGPPTGTNAAVDPPAVDPTAPPNPKPKSRFSTLFSRTKKTTNSPNPTSNKPKSSLTKRFFGSKNAKPVLPVALGNIDKEYPNKNIDVSFRLPEGVIPENEINVSVTRDGKKLMFNFKVPPETKPESKMTHKFDIKTAIASPTSFTNRFRGTKKNVITDPSTTTGKVISESDTKQTIEVSFFLPDGAKVQDIIKVSVTTRKNKNLMFNYVVTNADVESKITETFKLSDAIPAIEETTSIKVTIPEGAKANDLIQAPFKYKDKNYTINFLVRPDSIPGSVIPLEVNMKDAIISNEPISGKMTIAIIVPPNAKKGSTIKAPVKHNGKDLVIDFILPRDVDAGSKIYAQINIDDAKEPGKNGSEPPTNSKEPGKNAPPSEINIANDEQKKDMSKRCIDIMTEMDDPAISDDRKRELLIQLAKHLIILATLINK